ncbi:MAG: dihydrofolate reductase [Sphingobacteriia bacterium]|jgi:dihydrofolate reductase|nr:MAG: dihydrofolate reductase [Sphingobacteriia bacterium]TAG31766.1 MAG: dihydrofolate reductase [Sphingobacteriia bacterium]TAH06711.1 MAG: dihydrofolate reductase [Sphingobacteriia bacterium]
MLISLIVAASTNNAIGKNNELLWKLPNDMKFFKQTTWAMPVLMGRKTFESLKGKPLNGRLNIVITRNNNYEAAGAVVVNSLQKAIAVAAENDYKEVFVIGGGEIYAAAMQQAQQLYLTRVEVAIEGDTYFPAIEASEWKLVMDEFHEADEKHMYAYRFQKWIKQL